MHRSLWGRFLALLVTVVAVGLSATFLLRELMVQDFRVYLEGEMEDRVYWLTASLEGSFERRLEWEPEELSELLSWASMMGIDARLYDVDGYMLQDTSGALERLPFYISKRVSAISGHLEPSGSFVPYGLFIGGAEIGKLEVRFLAPGKESLYIRRSNRFLVLSIVALGSAALMLSLVVSHWLTRPIRQLTEASAAVAAGDLSQRVEVGRGDEIGRLAASFNRMAENLVLQDELRKKLTANVAHELRTPLTAVRAELEGMIDGLIPPEKDNLRSINDEIGRLRTVLDGMEELAQAEASGLTLSPRNFELGPFLSDMAERFERVFDEKGVSLEIYVPEGLQAFADPERLSQVVINLLSNALRGTGPGGRVTVSASENAGGGLSLEITDTGEGIDPAIQPYIFERFYRGRAGGLGIGLTIVRELVEAHGGSVMAGSSPGKGSVFTVILPS
jgi:two-component system sensor histidine kinase BaeS